MRIVMRRHSDLLLVELVNVTRSDGSPYAESNWRVRQCGSWQKLAFLRHVLDTHVGYAWGAILPDGTLPETMGSSYHTGLGLCSVSGDTIMLSTPATNWRYRILTDDEADQYYIARAKYALVRRHHFDDSSDWLEIFEEEDGLL